MIQEKLEIPAIGNQALLIRPDGSGEFPGVLFLTDIWGIRPGPLMMTEHPDVFWGLVASMYIGNIMLLVLNLPLIGLWIQILRIPYGVMFPLILVFCIVGVYGTTGSAFHLGLMLAFNLDLWGQTWFQAKLVLVFALSGYQGWLGAYGKKLANGERPLSGKAVRMINEIPGIAAALIVVLVIVRPF